MKNNFIQQIGNIAVVNIWWFSGKDTVGIVLGEDQITKEKKYYIGRTQAEEFRDQFGDVQIVMPHTEEEDIEYIVNWGAKFSSDQFERMFNNIILEGK